jgi:hypothetical protein
VWVQVPPPAPTPVSFNEIRGLINFEVVLESVGKTLPHNVYGCVAGSLEPVCGCFGRHLDHECETVTRVIHTPWTASILHFCAPYSRHGPASPALQPIGPAQPPRQPVMPIPCNLTSYGLFSFGSLLATTAKSLISFRISAPRTPVVLGDDGMLQPRAQRHARLVAPKAAPAHAQLAALSASTSGTPGFCSRPVLRPNGFTMIPNPPSSFSERTSRSAAPDPSHPYSRRRSADSPHPNTSPSAAIGQHPCASAQTALESRR